PPFLRDAGYPFRDLGIHCLTLMQAFLGPVQDVEAEWRSVGGQPSIAFDEWRAVVRCRDGDGQFQLSWNVQPLQHQVVVQGTHGVMHLDLFSLTSTRRRRIPGPRAVERALNTATGAATSLGQTILGTARYATG